MERQSTQNNQESIGSGLLSEIIESGITLKRLYAIPENLFDYIYRVGHQEYQAGRLDNALRYFDYLYRHDHTNADYAFAMAAVYQRQKHYQQALDIYTIAFLGKRDNYQAMYHAGECQLHLLRPAKAKKCFQYVIEWGGDDFLTEQSKDYLDLLQEIRMEYQGLNPEKKEDS